MRTLLLCLMACGLPLTAQARPGMRWDALSGLRESQAITVITLEGARHSGALAGVDDRGIALQGPGGRETIARVDVRRVEIGGKHLRNAAIGAVAGMAAGAGVAAAGSGCRSNCIGPSRGAVAAIVGSIGAIAGAVIGAVLPAHQTVYRAPGT